MEDVSDKTGQVGIKSLTTFRSCSTCIAPIPYFRMNRLLASTTVCLRHSTTRTEIFRLTGNALRGSARPCFQANFLPARWKSFHASTSACHGGKGRPAPGTGVKLRFEKHNGEVIREVEANLGDDLVDVSWEWDLDIEAACEKSIACSTCHVILDDAVYGLLEEPSDDENDMLDLAFGLTDTSRLGCQVKVTQAMNGSTIRLPAATRNMRVDSGR